MVGFCEHDTETSGLIKGGEFPDQLSNYELLKDLGIWQKKFTTYLSKYG
jgi:hypothetical protein